MNKETSKFEREKWIELVRKLKIGDTLMVTGNDKTVQELRFEGFKDNNNGTLEIILQPLTLEWIEKKKK